jgi:hypothetical protein
MRYVSFHAWGTVRADGDRRKTSLDRIIRNLWTPDPFKAGIPSFVAGGGVLWIPVVVGSKGMMIPSGPKPPELGPGEFTGWLAARQPPLGRRRMEEKGLSSPLVVNITDRLRSQLEAKHEKRGQLLDVFWDCRFLLHFDIDKMPDDVIRGILDDGEEIWLHPHTRWYWPKVMHYKPKLESETLLHSTLSVPREIPVELDRDAMTSWSFQFIEEMTSSWIKIEWIRSISAL